MGNLTKIVLMIPLVTSRPGIAFYEVIHNNCDDEILEYKRAHNKEAAEKEC